MEHEQLRDRIIEIIMELDEQRRGGLVVGGKKKKKKKAMSEWNKAVKYYKSSEIAAKFYDKSTKTFEKDPKAIKVCTPKICMDKYELDTKAREDQLKRAVQYQQE